MTSTTPGTVPTTDELTAGTEVRAIVEARSEQLRTGDADAIVASFAPEVVTFDLDPPLAHRSDEVLDATRLREWLAGHGGSVGLEIRDLQVAVSGELAYAHSLQRMHDPADEQFSLWFRSTTCLRRTADGWRITHEHNSVPFHMDESMRAAVDLEP